MHGRLVIDEIAIVERSYCLLLLAGLRELIWFFTVLQYF